ncbi:hypothetical protein [Aquidulcibacter sp.]|uniref:hypothetical protein n=1 Tax=Aquidulcibacter sp. TaxID=2052990 RepID=UPI0025C72B97|nr:hypothetical protein [Aquidulcibacter sp.]MCA3695104.1 hypothetical protein [Aquidulcibacter sp.]
MTKRILTAVPTFITFEGEAGPVSLGLHNIIRFAPCRRDPENRTFIWSRGHHHTTTIVTLPHAQVEALIQEKLEGRQ